MLEAPLYQISPENPFRFRQDFLAKQKAGADVRHLPISKPISNKLNSLLDRPIKFNLRLNQWKKCVWNYWFRSTWSDTVGEEVVWILTNIVVPSIHSDQKSLFVICWWESREKWKSHYLVFNRGQSHGMWLGHQTTPIPI